MIFRAEISDVKKLTEIALKSKAFWGYSNKMLQKWHNDLTITKKMMQKMLVFKFFVDEKIVGFYIINQNNEKSVELEFLFVLPEFIGKGIGSQLLLHAIETSKKMNVKRLNVISDPNAVDFYTSHNFIWFDEITSKIPNRFLPKMVYRFD